MSAREAFLRSPLATRPMIGVAQNQEVTIVAGFRNRLGQPCRVVVQSVYIAGQRVRATGTVCQEPDGRWALER